ncbi:MAG: trypsin-like serine peptidase [Bacteriovoracaceae bacterium]
MSFKSLFVLLIFCLSLSSGVQSEENEVIYGNDDRELISSSSDPRYQTWAKATAAIVVKDLIKPAFGDLISKIDAVELKNSNYQICEDEPFADRLITSHCSAFLVGDDVMVTAGHCVNNQFDCDNLSFVFDYRQDLIHESKDLFIFTDTVYSCKEIIDSKLDFVTEVDYAVIRLDRKVKNRKPLKFRTGQEKLSDSSSLAVVGYPMGLPVVVADNAKVRDNGEEDFFTSNLDAFKGNSGGPVINIRTGAVEGIVISGEDDFQYVSEKRCFVSNQCEDDGCLGEKALRITHIEDILTQAIQN